MFDINYIIGQKQRLHEAIRYALFCTFCCQMFFLFTCCHLKLYGTAMQLIVFCTLFFFVYLRFFLIKTSNLIDSELVRTARLDYIPKAVAALFFFLLVIFAKLCCETMMDKMISKLNPV